MKSFRAVAFGFRLSKRMNPTNQPVLELSQQSAYSKKTKPFDVTGNCRSLVYREGGKPTTVLHLEYGFVHHRKEMEEAHKKSGWAHVKMLVAPVNPSDINQLEGTYPLKSDEKAAVAGNEGVGEVIEIGDDVHHLKVGDRVIPAIPALGTWREQLICEASALQPIPADLPIEVAATLLVNPPTAYRLLNDFGKLSEGDVIIQNGANSAVGRYIIQLAALRGIKTINIIRDRPNYDELERELRGLGASMVLKQTQIASNLTLQYVLKEMGKPAILGFNCVAGGSIGEMARFLQEGSTIVTYGGMSRRPNLAPSSLLIFQDIRLVGFWMSRWYQRVAQSNDPQLLAERTRMLSELCDLFSLGKLKLPPMRKYAFATEWKEALLDATAEKPTKPQAKHLLIINKF